MEYENTSEFNDALGFLKRLDAYFRVANHYAEHEQAHYWLNSLITIYRELYNFAKEKQEENIRELKHMVSEYNKKINEGSAEEGISLELYWKLHELHIYLKKVFHDSGLETKMMDSAMNALK